MKRIYVAAPYTHGDVAANVATAMAAAHELLDRGTAPYCPHLTHYLHLARQRPYDEWLALDLEWLACCDAVLRLSGHSPGADRECARAAELGIPVYHSLALLLEAL